MPEVILRKTAFSIEETFMKVGPSQSIRRVEQLRLPSSKTLLQGGMRPIFKDSWTI